MPRSATWSMSRSSPPARTASAARPWCLPRPESSRHNRSATVIGNPFRRSAFRGLWQLFPYYSNRLDTDANRFPSCSSARRCSSRISIRSSRRWRRGGARCAGRIWVATSVHEGLIAGWLVEAGIDGARVRIRRAPGYRAFPNLKHGENPPLPPKTADIAPPVAAPRCALRGGVRRADQPVAARACARSCRCASSDHRAWRGSISDRVRSPPRFRLSPVVAEPVRGGRWYVCGRAYRRASS